MREVKRDAEKRARERVINPFTTSLLSMRVKSGFTMRELSRRLGISIGTYSNWEYGYNLPLPENVYILHDFFAMQGRITTDDLAKFLRAFLDVRQERHINER